MKIKFSEYLYPAQKSVYQAMKIASSIQREFSVLPPLIKSDKSPVTLADFAVQAYICHELHRHFPDLPVIAEENTGLLTDPENKSLLELLEKHLQKTGFYLDRESLLLAIDRGNNKPGDLFWTLDPIDGTKGFMRKEQYAIALALVAGGEVQIGILGCPRLQVNDTAKNGSLLVSEKGKGSFLIFPGPEKKLTLKHFPVGAPLQIVQSYESDHGDMKKQSEVAAALTLSGPPLKVDSQVKYAMIALNQAQLYLRIPNPKQPGHREKIWDHAAGSLIAAEAGALVSDLDGRMLDFSLGFNLDKNHGILVSPPERQEEILEVLSRLPSAATRYG